jgi:hypothetical protein
VPTGTYGEWGKPAGGPWWRFVPKSPALGYLELFLGIFFIVQEIVYLATGADRGTAQAVLQAILAVVGVAAVIRSIDGLRILRARRSGARV